MRRFIPLFVTILLALPCLGQSVAANTSRANLTILTDENMLLPLADLSRLYATENKTPLTIVVQNADTAEKQIEQGLEAHVLITANTALIGRLTDQGLTDVSSRRTVARTQLALVTTSDLSKQADIAKRISFASILAATPNLPVICNDASTLEGTLAAQVVQQQEFAAVLGPRIATKPNHEDVVAALRDEISLALILAADAVAEPDIRVLSLLPNDLSKPVNFEVVVLGSEAMNQARSFASFLTTHKAQRIFNDFGYQSPSR